MHTDKESSKKNIKRLNLRVEKAGSHFVRELHHFFECVCVLRALLFYLSATISLSLARST